MIKNYFELMPNHDMKTDPSMQLSATIFETDLPDSEFTGVYNSQGNPIWVQFEKMKIGFDLG